ncbi:hypothetical protein EGW08_016029, partial [Elysia chlorotica]
DYTYPGATVHEVRRSFSEQNVLITEQEDILQFIGLCGGEAATYMGILRSGECLSVRLASSLTFGSRSVIRAYVYYYLRDQDTRDTGGRVPPMVQKMIDRNIKFTGRYYLKSISYGIQEVIVLQFQFVTRAEADRARAISLNSTRMTDYMAQIRTTANTPKVVKIINVSSREPKSYAVAKFHPLSTTVPYQWDRAVRHVSVLERYVEAEKDRIRHPRSPRPHLKYYFAPFLAEELIEGKSESANPYQWRNISMIEATLRRDLKLVRKFTKKCRKNRTPVCKRVRQHREIAAALSREVHRKREQWVKVTAEEQASFIQTYRVKADTNSRLTQNLVKEVRAMRKAMKKKAILDKAKRRNRVPTTTSRAQGNKQRPNRRRNNRGKKLRNGNNTRNGSSTSGEAVQDEQIDLEKQQSQTNDTPELVQQKEQSQTNDTLVEEEVPRPAEQVRFQVDYNRRRMLRARARAMRRQRERARARASSSNQ